MYTTKSGDTWDVIAKEVYGSEYHAAGGRAGRTDAAVEIRGEL